MRKGARLDDDMVDDLLRRLMTEDSDCDAPAWRMWVEIPLRVGWDGRRAMVSSRRHRRGPNRMERRPGALHGRRGQISGTAHAALGGLRARFGTRPRRGS